MNCEIHSEAELLEYFKQWNISTFQNDKIVLSEMLDCKLYQLDLLMSYGKVIGPIIVSENVNLWHKFAQGQPTGGMIEKFGSPQHKKFVDAVYKIIKALGYMNGAYCIEAFEKANGEPVLLEVNPRRPANSYNWMYKALSGIDWEGINILGQW